jgi:N-acetylglucosaminyl-diphospho-decaprenol L-rhamnosyltransferase
MSLLSVIIVNYRSGGLLRGCLDSIIQSRVTCDFEIFVVNNDSVQDLSPISDRCWRNTQIIQNASNLGFGAAANQAFLQSRGEFLLLLNPDVRVGSGSIESLVETLKAYPLAGIVLPQLRNQDGSLQYSCRQFYTYRTLLLRRGPWKQVFADHPAVKRHLMQDWDHQLLSPVDWGLGAAMLVRRQAVQEATFFDERFFVYFEDVDLCLRMRRSGWQVLYNPASVMVHAHRRDSARPLSWLAKRHHLLSLMKFLWKYRFRLGSRTASPLPTVGGQKQAKRTAVSRGLPGK